MSKLLGHETVLSVLHIDPSSLCLVGSIFRHLGMTNSNGLEEMEVGTCLKVVEYSRLPSLGLYFDTFGDLKLLDLIISKGTGSQHQHPYIFGLFQLPVKSHLILFY